MMLEFGPEEIGELAGRLGQARCIRDEMMVNYRITRFVDLNPEDIKLATKLLLAMVRDNRQGKPGAPSE